MGGRLTWSRPSIVAGIYLVLATIMTWPLVASIDRRIAGDLGDPLFNSWVLLWTSGQALRFLRGDLSALSDYWHGNIFHPAPLTLAYSEHLAPQMLQALPVLAVTGNAVLAYNLLILATIVLSGLGMYLLVREFTGQPLAAFLAGLAFAFAPYRVDQWSHLDVLSSQWMPFALFGLRRFFVTGRLRPLVGGAAAIVAQGLSCLYYLAYFTPFAAAYCVYETIARGLRRDRRTWYALAGAGAGALAVSLLCLVPYMQVRGLGRLGVRAQDEIERNSADTHAFATASQSVRLWGSRIRALPRNEGQGFPGFAVLGFAALAVGAGLRRSIVRAREASVPTAWWRQAIAALAGVVLLAQVTLLVHLLVTGQSTVAVFGLLLRQRYRPLRLALQFAVLGIALLLASPTARRVARGTPRSHIAFFGWAALAAAALSLGPSVHVHGNPLGPGLYAVLFRWVPGFDGLRVPSLYFMVVAMLLAVLSGLGAATLLAAPGRWRRIVVVSGMAMILAESFSVPVETNAPLPVAPGLRAPVDLIDGSTLGPLYQVVRDLPDRSVLVEFPFGETAFETQYMFYAGYHRKPIVNGYSGFTPGAYAALVPMLQSPATDPRAWAALLVAGATHAIVHEGGYVDDRGRAVSDWLTRSGARQIAVVGTNRMFALR